MFAKSIGVLLTAVALAGCGAGTSKTSTSAKPSSSAPAQSTLAHVCASHPQALGTIAGGLFAFKYGMEHGSTVGFSAVASGVSAAVADLQSASVGSTSSNLPAMRRLLQLLQSLSDSLTTPPKYPTAVIGDQDVALIQSTAKQAGCPLGG
jgi:hypothetical protein